MVSRSTTATWVAPVARIGLVAKGIVYTMLGVVAFMAAFHINGMSNNDTDKQGILNFVQELPAGKILLTVIAFGLFCYCLWRGIQTFADTEHKGTKPKGISSRLRYFVSGLVYASFAFLAVRIVFNEDNGSDGGGNNKMISQILNKPAGEIWIGVVAVIIAGVGIYQVYYGLSGKYKKHVDTLELKKTGSSHLLKAGIIGYVARGIVWLIIAYMMFKTAIHHNSREAGDTSKALQFLQHTYGNVLLAIVGLGLLLYGIFNFLRARYEDFK